MTTLWWVKKNISVALRFLHWLLPPAFLAPPPPSKTNRSPTQNVPLLTSVPMVMMKEHNWANDSWTHLFAPTVSANDLRSAGRSLTLGKTELEVKRQGIIRAAGGALTFGIAEQGARAGRVCLGLGGSPEAAWQLPPVKITFFKENNPAGSQRSLCASLWVCYETKGRWHIKVRDHLKCFWQRLCKSRLERWTPFF